MYRRGRLGDSGGIIMGEPGEVGRPAPEGVGDTVEFGTLVREVEPVAVPP